MPLTTSSPGSGPGSSAGKAAPQATPAQPFQNLSAYLSANAPQVSQQAGQMAGNLSNEMGKTTADINQATTGFGNQVQAGYAQPNQTLTDQAASNPTDFVSNPANVKAFQNLYNDTYTGPANFESSTPYTNVNAEVGKAVNDANQVGSTAGLQTYFQGQNPTATPGGNMLDTVLLQGSPEAYAQVTNAAKPLTTLPDYLSGQVTTADQGVTNATNAAQNEAKALQSQFTGPSGVIPTFTSDLQGKVSQNQAAIDKAVADLESGGILTQADENILGIGNTPQNFNFTQPSGDKGSVSRTPIEELASLYGTGLSPTIYKNPVVPPWSNFLPNIKANPANTATTADYSKAAALNLLLGGNANLPIDQSTIGQAGTGQSSPLNIQALSDYLNPAFDTANQNGFIYQKNPDLTGNYAFNPFNIAGYKGNT